MQKVSAPALTAKYSNAHQAPSALDLGKYFRPKRASEPFVFKSVGVWENIEHIVRKNLARFGEFERPSRFMTTHEVALEEINPKFAQKGLNTRFMESLPEDHPFLGSANLVLCDSTSATDTPILVGHNYPDLALEFDIVRHLHGDRWGQSEEAYFGGSIEELKAVKDEAVRALQSLCHVMLVNDLAIGYLSSEASIRFVNIIPRSNGLGLQISNPFDSRNSCQALIAVGLEAYYGHPYLRYYHGFNATPETVEDPNIEPLSSFDEGSIGKIKWWVANRVNRQTYTVTIDRRDSNDIDNPNRCIYSIKSTSSAWRSGAVTINDDRMQPALLKICTYETCIRREASMLQYALDKGAKHVPAFILYGHILGNDFHLLALEPFGRQVVPDDLLVAGVQEEMKLALSELHHCGIMLFEFTLDTFGIEYIQSVHGAVPVVRIISFTCAKLYRRIPKVAREKEHLKLQEFFEHEKTADKNTATQRAH